MGRQGDVLANPRRRERVELVETATETAGKRLTMRVTQLPTPARMPAHCHPRQRETFTVRAGALTYALAGEPPRIARTGDEVIVEAGAAHSWWNDGPETVELIGVLEPAGRWLELMETIYGLANEGKVNSRGVPNLLQIAVIAREFREEWVPTAIPSLARTLLVPVLAAVGRALGYRPTYPRYSHHAPAVTPL